jgi:hypothetical protein
MQPLGLYHVLDAGSETYGPALKMVSDSTTTTPRCATYSDTSFSATGRCGGPDGLTATGWTCE